MTSSCLRIGFRNGYSFHASGFRTSQTKPLTVVKLKKESNDQFKRNMASGRNHFVSKASKKVIKSRLYNNNFINYKNVRLKLGLIF